MKIETINNYITTVFRPKNETFLNKETIALFTSPTDSLIAN